jgi:hypothetical protein
LLTQQASPDAPSRRRLDHLSSLKKLAAGRQNKAYKQNSGAPQQQHMLQQLL